MAGDGERTEGALQAHGRNGATKGRRRWYDPGAMCRNIRPLFNFEPPATDEEVHAAALQYVRKVSGTREPRGRNQEIFDSAVDEIAAVTRRLVDSLETKAAKKNREEEAMKAKARYLRRYD